MYRNRNFSSLTLISAAVALSVLAGCSEQTVDEPAGVRTVTPDTNIIDKSTHPLGIGALKAAYGTYATCDGHDDDSTWSLLTSDGVAGDRGANPALSVVADNTDCTLTLTDIVTGSTVYTGTPDIELDTTFATDGSAFKTSSNVLGFYANADLSAKTFAAAFTVNIVFSDDALATSAAANASLGVTASSEATGADAPDYSNTNDLAIIVDGGDIVTGRSGSLSLALGTFAGDSYVIKAGEQTSLAVADVDAAYTAAIGTEVLITGTPVEVPGTALLALGVDLSPPVLRSVIVRREVDGVPSYQIITVTFSP